MMLLPYPIDLIPQYLGKMWMRLKGWNPIGDRVVVRFDPPDDSLVTGEYSAVITEVGDDIVFLRLDSPVTFDGENVDRLAATSRYSGHQLPRLLFADCAMNFYQLGSRREGVNQKVQLGTGIMRLRK
jgi:hypothetical protein